MNNGNTPVMPIFNSNGICNFDNSSENTGLTKREYFAAMAMQGLLANSVIGDSNLHETAAEWISDITEASVEFSDALLEALENKHE